MQEAGKRKFYVLLSECLAGALTASPSFSAQKDAILAVLRSGFKNVCVTKKHSKWQKRVNYQGKQFFLINICRKRETTSFDFTTNWVMSELKNTKRAKTYLNIISAPNIFHSLHQNAVPNLNYCERMIITLNMASPSLIL